MKLLGCPTGALDIPPGLSYSSGPVRHPSGLDIPPLSWSSRHTGPSRRTGSPTLPGRHPSSCLVILARRDIPPAWVDPGRVIPAGGLDVPLQWDKQPRRGIAAAWFILIAIKTSKVAFTVRSWTQTPTQTTAAGERAHQARALSSAKTR